MVTQASVMTIIFQVFPSHWLTLHVGEMGTSVYLSVVPLYMKFILTPLLFHYLHDASCTYYRIRTQQIPAVIIILIMS